MWAFVVRVLFLLDAASIAAQAPPSCSEAHAQLAAAHGAVAGLEGQLAQLLVALSNATAAVTIRQLAVNECARDGPILGSPIRGARPFMRS
jgi:hypothetical protein